MRRAAEPLSGCVTRLVTPRSDAYPSSGSTESAASGNSCVRPPGRAFRPLFVRFVAQRLQHDRAKGDNSCCPSRGEAQARFQNPTEPFACLPFP